MWILLVVIGAGWLLFALVIHSQREEILIDTHWYARGAIRRAKKKGLIPNSILNGKRKADDIATGKELMMVFNRAINAIYDTEGVFSDDSLEESMVFLKFEKLAMEIQKKPIARHGDLARLLVKAAEAIGENLDETPGKMMRELPDFLGDDIQPETVLTLEELLITVEDFVTYVRLVRY